MTDTIDGGMLSDVIDAHDLGVAGGYIIESAMVERISGLEDENERLRSCLSDDKESARLIMGENAMLREELKYERQTSRSRLERIDQLKAENAKLREELEQWHRLTAGIELPEYPITEFKPKDLERENSKLRELCNELWQWERFGCGACNLISLDDCQTDLYSADCLMREAFPDRMRELGIEVDE